MQKPNRSTTIVNPSWFAREIHQRTLSFFDNETRSFSDHRYLPGFLQLARSYLGEGKAYRALAVSVGNFIAGGGPIGTDERALQLGVAMELYQASALVHDDLIDNSPTRRGHDSTHIAAARKFNDADTGEAVAILIGDFLLSLNQLATTRALAVTDAAVANHIHAYMARISAEVAWGQYLDVLTEHAPLDNPESLQRDVTDVIALKSGHYSVMRPLILGALLQSPDRELLRAIETVGKSWGLAFQMRDDVIGIFGDAELTGKPTSSDIREGKRTVLLALTLQLANDQQIETIASVLGNPDASEDHIDAVREIIRETGAFHRHEEIIKEYVTKGHDIVDTLDLTPAQTQVLRQFGDLLVQRVH
ncbi:MAG: polyprenyl synthetase family protein [Actinomycetaceae bacterium]|nr:polyprenyl synthetase family protein [Actinomycetaceae bacterium]